MRIERSGDKGGQQKTKVPPTKNIQLADKTNLMSKGKTNGSEKGFATQALTKRKRQVGRLSVKDILIKAKGENAEPSPKRRRENAVVTNLDKEDKV